MLSRRLADCATFLMNTGIYPTDGFEFKSHRFDVSSITSETRITPALSSTDARSFPSSTETVRGLLDSANHVFNSTAAEFLNRERVKPPK
jgi:hypothetical protein